MGFNTNTLIDPADFYDVISRNLSKFSDEDKFIVLRFFDKLADSSGFSSLCKSKLKCHIDKKDIKLKADLIFNSDENISIEVLSGVAYLNKSGDDNWLFKLSDNVIAEHLSNNDALKIVKDVNNAFLMKNKGR